MIPNMNGFANGLQGEDHATYFRNAPGNCMFSLHEIKTNIDKNLNLN